MASARCGLGADDLLDLVGDTTQGKDARLRREVDEKIRVAPRGRVTTCKAAEHEGVSTPMARDDGGDFLPVRHRPPRQR